MSPLLKRSMRSTGKAPDIALPPNGKIPQAPKPGHKTQQRQSNDADKDIQLDVVPTPAAPRPIPCKKPVTVSRTTPGTDAEDETFIPPHALQNKIPNCAAAEVSDLPPPAQPCPLPVPPPCSASPDSDNSGGTPPLSQPHHDETPPPPSSQPRRPPPPLRLPSLSSSPTVHDPGCTPSPSNFETTRAAEQLAISQMRPAKLDEEDEQVFEEEAKAQFAKGKKGKGKGKGKGKNSVVEGPFKSGPIPNQAKERAFTIHANFEKQIQDLAVEIGKAPHLLFSLVASSQDWNRIVAAERDKFCKDNLGDKWEDPEALTKLFEPIMIWHLEKYETYVEELKLEGTFDKVIGKVQHEFMHLADTAFKYNDVHCFGFIVNLQPDHTGCTGSAMWGETPAFEWMKIDKKGVISQQITEWETLLRRADMALNGNAEEQEKELWTVQIMGDKHDHARQAFLAWLGCDIEWPMDACLPDGAYYDFKDAANGLEQVQINMSNRTRSADYLNEHAIQIISWKEEDMERKIDDPDLKEVALVLSTAHGHLITVEDSVKFTKELTESNGLPAGKS
ncbi:hypothetical protein DXG01_015049 [Tephrocybe rancida]|nr:hypothetical protein DXG01_015049 [Tephrocybe rancida]